MGQSNIAAGATLGSNHNSRAADGEMIAARGFWPGLCVSIKHNSRFASFSLLAKGDYSYELNIPLPFSLVSNDVSSNQLSLMPAYWFMYNLYALARNAGKYVDRDKRTNKLQQIEYDFLAPDSVNEIFSALDLLKKFTALSQNKNDLNDTPENVLIQAGETILEDQNNSIKTITLNNSGLENSSRPVCISKVDEAYRIYKDLVVYYGVTNIIDFINSHSIKSFDELTKALPNKAIRLEWTNVGGQLLPLNSLQTALNDIKNNSIQSWEEVHQFYEENGKIYKEQKLRHAYASLLELQKIQNLEANCFKKLLYKALDIKEWMVKAIYDSRAKDYQNQFRQMVYGNDQEMEVVVGKLEDNVFINQQKEEFVRFRSSIGNIISDFNL